METMNVFVAPEIGMDQNGPWQLPQLLLHVLLVRSEVCRHSLLELVAAWQRQGMVAAALSGPQKINLSV